MTTNELTAVLNGVFHNHAEKSFGVNEAVAIIAAVIALGALFVAYLARQDSKKSADAAQRATDLLARQLDLEINERDRKIQKEVAESRPYLTWRGGHHAGDGLSCSREFENVGGEVKNIGVTTDDKEIAATISPITFLPQKGLGKVEFTSPKRINSFSFTITSTTKLEELCKITFRAVIDQRMLKISQVT